MGDEESKEITRLRRKVKGQAEAVRALLRANSRLKRRLTCIEPAYREAIDALLEQAPAGTQYRPGKIALGDALLSEELRRKISAEARKKAGVAAR
jgi:hypothetical protein